MIRLASLSFFLGGNRGRLMVSMVLEVESSSNFLLGVLPVFCAVLVGVIEVEGRAGCSLWAG